jgi:hypothetical protein
MFTHFLLSPLEVGSFLDLSQFWLNWPNGFEGEIDNVNVDRRTDERQAIRSSLEL